MNSEKSKRGGIASLLLGILAFLSIFFLHGFATGLTISHSLAVSGALAVCGVFAGLVGWAESSARAATIVGVGLNCLTLALVALHHSNLLSGMLVSH
jgi:hypothetical protein